MTDTWTIPAADPGDPERRIQISAAAGPLMLDLSGFDGFATADEARKIAFALMQAAHELDRCRPIGDSA